MTTDFDRKIMQRCLDLARRALGKTSPNPLVGAVVVRDGEVVGEGFHPQAGMPHAEVFALREAGEKAQGATIYVNLEPCNHYGKTPPCTEAIIQAGIKQVVIGTVDPDNRVSGGGIKRLMGAGIDVRVGIEEKDCLLLNEAFIFRVTHQRPFGILKYAMTLDGKIATMTGDSKWVTGAMARNYVHHLRSACDIVVVGGNTVRKDNPRLTSHGVASHNPCRGVISPSFNLPFDAHLWATQEAKTIIFTTPQPDSPLKSHLLNQGVEVVELADLSISLIMDNFYQRGFNSVLWECGGNLSAKVMGAGAIQKVLAFIAPKIIGGNDSYHPMGDLGIHHMQNAFNLRDLSIQSLGDDFLIQGYLKFDEKLESEREETINH